MKDVGGAVLAGSTPPFLGRERAAVDLKSLSKVPRELPVFHIRNYQENI